MVCRDQKVFTHETIKHRQNVKPMDIHTNSQTQRDMPPAFTQIQTNIDYTDKNIQTTDRYRMYGVRLWLCMREK